MVVTNSSEQTPANRIIRGSVICDILFIEYDRGMADRDVRKITVGPEKVMMQVVKTSKPRFAQQQDYADRSAIRMQ